MKNVNRQACFLISLLLITPIAIAQLHYQVRVTNKPEVLKLQLTLPANSKSPTQLAVRGIAWGLAPQVQHVRCSDQPVIQDTEGYWVAPADCTIVTWEVKADRVGNAGANANEQRTLVLGSPPWYLLSEPTSILRPQNVDDQTATIENPLNPNLLLGPTQVNNYEYLVPSAKNAPEFYVLGTPAQSTQRWRMLTLTHISDSPEQFKLLDLKNLHSQALNYLITVVPPPETLPTEQRHLQMIWLGVAESNGQAGGAAGSRSFVANYIVGSAEHQDRNTYRTLLVAAHEQFHQLADMLRGNRPAQPIWFNESLAQYYALKSLMQFPSSEIQTITSNFINPDRLVNYGLVELERQYMNGNQSVYELFYTQGATFWNELDSMISQTTNGKHSLDEYIKELLSTDFTLNGGLPDSFSVLMCQIIGAEKWNILVNKYLGV